MPDPVRRSVSPPLPAFAPRIFGSARCALDDRRHADEIARRALAGAPTENAALRALAALLASTPMPRQAVTETHTPVAANTDDTRLDRFVHALSPLDRLAMMLVLTMGVPRAAVDDWLGTHGQDQRVAVIADAAGRALGHLREAMPPDCRPFCRSMLDMDDPSASRRVRLHMLGCEHCAAYLPGLQRTLGTLRAWFDDCRASSAAEPADHQPNTATHGLRAWLLSPSTARIVAVCTLVVLLIALLVARPARSSLPAGSATITAAHVLDRALRYHTARPRGILHERFRVVLADGALLVERFVDYQPPHAFRLIVRAPNAAAPLLDLATDGTRRLRYVARSGSQRPTRVTIENAQVADIQGLLRQLPAVGQLGSFPPLRRPGAQELLQDARRASARLLGSSAVLDRSAYLLAYDRGPDQVVLAVDAETFVLARATVVAGRGRSSASVLWEAEQIEILAAAPPGTFDTGSGQTHDSLPNPRHLLQDPFSNLRLAEVARWHQRIPVAAERPPGTILAYLRTTDFFGMVQAYEGEHVSVAIVSPPASFPVRPPVVLYRRSGITHWRVVDDNAERRLIQIEFGPGGDPTRRSRLYLWHADLSAAERLAAAEQVVASITWVNDVEAAAFEHRFVSPPAGGT